jgi:hypothetical protein
MTRKTYIKLAQIFKEVSENPEMDKNTTKAIQRMIADVLEEDDDRFDKMKFNNACGIIKLRS